MLEVATEAMESLNPQDMSADQVRKWIVDAIRLERLSRGEPEHTSSVETRGGRGGALGEYAEALGSMTDDELARFVENMQIAGRAINRSRGKESIRIGDIVDGDYDEEEEE